MPNLGGGPWPKYILISLSYARLAFYEGARCPLVSRIMGLYPFWAPNQPDSHQKGKIWDFFKNQKEKFLKSPIFVTFYAILTNLWCKFRIADVIHVSQISIVSRHPEFRVVSLNVKSPITHDVSISSTNQGSPMAHNHNKWHKLHRSDSSNHLSDHQNGFSWATQVNKLHNLYSSEGSNMV